MAPDRSRSTTTRCSPIRSSRGIAWCRRSPDTARASSCRASGRTGWRPGSRSGSTCCSETSHPTSGVAANCSACCCRSSSSSCRCSAASIPAIDLTAGEKERGTMQTLLCAPLRAASRSSSASSWPSGSIALITALVNVVSLAATIARMLPGASVRLPLASFVATFVLLVPVTLTISALFLAVAAFARDFKDGQNFLTPVYMVLAMPAGGTMLPGVRAERRPRRSARRQHRASDQERDAVGMRARPGLPDARVVADLCGPGARPCRARVPAGTGAARRPASPACSLLGLERRPGRRAGPSVAIVSFAIVLVVAFYGSAVAAAGRRHRDAARGRIRVLPAADAGVGLRPRLPGAGDAGAARPAASGARGLRADWRIRVDGGRRRPDSVAAPARLAVARARTDAAARWQVRRLSGSSGWSLR